jgi:WD40 repeat protein
MSASGDGDQPELQLNDTPSEGLAAALQDPAPLTEDQQRELARLMDEEMTEPHDNGLQADEIKSMEIFADDSVQGFFKHAGPVYGLALNPSGQQLCLSGDGEETAWLWDITTGEAVTSHNDHTDSIIACEFSFDGQFYATGAMDGTIRVGVQCNSMQ